METSFAEQINRPITRKNAARFCYSGFQKYVPISTGRTSFLKAADQNRAASVPAGLVMKEGMKIDGESG